MRALSDYAAKEWLRGVPLKHGFKQIRNDLYLQGYLRKQTPELPTFLDAVRPLSDRPLLAIVAFEQPEVLQWLLFEAQQHLKDAQCLVFDNSMRSAMRAQIRGACAETQTPYLGLPKNHTRHVNRHHGLAMTWIYHHVFCELQPALFGYIDHDLLPIRPFSLRERMGNAPVFGLQKQAQRHQRWNLWAGYCFYRSEYLAARRLNFLYDFAAGLDTGGRNWTTVYREVNQEQIPPVPLSTEILHPAGGETREVSIIDNCWLHIGGISYNDAYRDRKAYFDDIEARRRNGTTWDELLKPE